MLKDSHTVMSNMKKSTLIKIDTNDLDFVSKKKDLEYIISQIYKEDDLK